MMRYGTDIDPGETLCFPRLCDRQGGHPLNELGIGPGVIEILLGWLFSQKLSRFLP